MNKIIVLAINLLIACQLYAQDFEFGKITPKETKLQKNEIDSFSNAVIIDEFGKTNLEHEGVQDKLVVHYYLHRKIKIFNPDAFNLATIAISEYGETGKVFHIKAITYNETNGKYEPTELEAKNIFHEQVNKDLALTKFTMPNLKPNSIIEYSYETYTPSIFNLTSWYFQGKYPTMHSIFNAVIPANFTYNVSLRGFLALKNSYGNVLHEEFLFGGHRFDCSSMYYEMDSIPAFVEEDYMTSSKNFISKIDFELAEVFYTDGTRKKFSTTWADEDKTLNNEENLGRQLRKKGFFKKALQPLLSAENDPLKKAKIVYKYIQQQFKWNEDYNCFTSGNIEKAFDKHTGNVADINISLVNALNDAGIPSLPVILSTRDNGAVRHLFPNITDFNYLIATVKINGKNYLLDATEPQMTFGHLPYRCLSDSGRVLSPKEDSYWIPLTTDQKISRTSSFVGKLLANGKIEGELIIKSDSYSGVVKRQSILSYPNLDAYVDNKTQQLPSLKINDYTIEGVDSTEQPLVEKYKVTLNFADSLNFSAFYFNPFLFEKNNKNPFTLEERNYPVDFGMLTDINTDIKITLPDNFQLERKPNNTHFMLPEKKAEFQFSISKDGNVLHCEYFEKINRTSFWPDDYFTLKQLYNLIIQTEQKDVVFKIKN